MINLEEFSEPTSNQLLMGNNFPPVSLELPNGRVSTDVHADQVSERCEEQTTEPSIDANCHADEQPSPSKRSRIDSPHQEHTFTLIGSEQQQHAARNGAGSDIVSYTEGCAYMSSCHSEGSSAVAYPANYEDITGDNMDFYGSKLHYSAVHGDYVPISMPNGLATVAESSPGSRSDSGLSSDMSSNHSGLAAYGYPSPCASSNSSIGMAINYDKNAAEKINPFLTGIHTNAIDVEQHASYEATQFGELNYSTAAFTHRYARERYLKTVEFLKSSNLFDITMRTAELMKRNHALQLEMDSLKNDVSQFLSSLAETNVCV